MEELEDVKKELEAKRQELERELESAKDKVSGIAGDLRRVDEALRALTKRKSSKGRGRSKQSKPAAEGPEAPFLRSLSSSPFLSHEDPLR